MLRFLQFGFVFFTALAVNGQNTFDSFKDRSVVTGTNFNYTAKTTATAVIEFSKANKDYINVNTLSDDLEDTDRSVFMWIKAPTNVSSTTQYMFSINAATGSTTRCLLGLDTSERLIVYDGGNQRVTTTDLGDDKWHYVGYTYNNTTHETKVYVDGWVEKTYTNAQPTLAGDRYSIGMNHSGTTSTSRHYDGALSEVSVWNTILDKADIVAAMASKITAYHPKYANLVGYYNGFGTIGQDTTILEDKSGNSNTGIVTNFNLDYSLTDAIVGYNALDWYTSYEWYKNGSLQATDTDFSVTAATDNFEIKLYRDNITTSDSWSTTIIENNLTVDNFLDQSICSNDRITYKAVIHKTAPLTFSKVDERWVNLNALQNDLAASDRSIFMWIKAPTDVSSSTQYIFSINSATGSVNKCLLGINTSEKLVVYDGATARTTTTDLGDDIWHFVGYTYNNSSNETKIYVDGVLEKTFTNDQGVLVEDRYSLGQKFDGPNTTGRHYDGLMTEVSIWNTVLETNEITAIMDAKIENTHAQYANLIGYYNFPDNNDDGTVLKDWSGNNNDGNITGTIISTTVFDDIPNFNSAGWFTKTWYKNTSEISTNPSAAIWPFLGTDSYMIESIRPFFKLTDIWNLTYSESIIDQPQDVSVHVGSNATFSVNAAGGSTYQWFQKYDEEDYFFKHYGSSELSSEEVWDLTVSDGDIYAATGAGIEVSRDKGTTWELWNSTKGMNYDKTRKIAVYEDNIFAIHGTSYSYSRDGGATFSFKSKYPQEGGGGIGGNNYGNAITIGNNSYIPSIFYFDANGDLYALCYVLSKELGSSAPYAAAVLKSTDFGVNFSLLSHFDLGENANYTHGLIEGELIVKGSTIAVTSGRDGFALSNDGGATFQVFNSENSSVSSNRVVSLAIYGDKIFLGTKTSGGNSLGHLYETDALGSYFTNIPFGETHSLTIKDGNLYVFKKNFGAKIYNISTQTMSQNYIETPKYVRRMTNYNGDFYLYAYTLYDTYDGMYIQKLSEELIGEATSVLTISNTVANDNDNKYLVEVSKGGCTNQSDKVRLFVQTGDIVKPVIESMLPIDDAIDFVVGDNMTFELDFDEPISKGYGTILIRSVFDKTYIATIDVAGSVVSITDDVATITPTTSQVSALKARIINGENEFYIEVPKEAFVDANGNTFAGIKEGDWDFTATVSAAPVLDTSNQPENNSIDASTPAIIQYDSSILKGTGNIQVRSIADDTIVLEIDITDSNVTIEGNQLHILFTEEQLATLKANLNSQGTSNEYSQQVAIGKSAASDVNDFYITMDTGVVKSAGGTPSGAVVGNDLSFNLADQTLSDKISVEKARLNIYPNPVTDVLYIKNKKENVEVQLIDLKGNVLYSGKDSQIDMSVYARGTYLLKITSEKNAAIFKIIK